MCWGEVDLDAAMWTVPAHRMKAGKLHRVPLSAPALFMADVEPPVPPAGVLCHKDLVPTVFEKMAAEGAAVLDSASVAAALYPALFAIPKAFEDAKRYLGRTWASREGGRLPLLHPKIPYVRSLGFSGVNAFSLVTVRISGKGFRKDAPVRMLVHAARLPGFRAELETRWKIERYDVRALEQAETGSDAALRSVLLHGRTEPRFGAGSMHDQLSVCDRAVPAWPTVDHARPSPYSSDSAVPAGDHLTPSYLTAEYENARVIPSLDPDQPFRRNLLVQPTDGMRGVDAVEQGRRAVKTVLAGAGRPLRHRTYTAYELFRVLSARSCLSSPPEEDPYELDLVVVRLNGDDRTRKANGQEIEYGQYLNALIAQRSHKRRPTWVLSALPWGSASFEAVYGRGTRSQAERIRPDLVELRLAAGGDIADASCIDGPLPVINPSTGSLRHVGGESWLLASLADLPGRAGTSSVAVDTVDLNVGEEDSCWDDKTSIVADQDGWGDDGESERHERERAGGKRRRWEIC